MVQLREIIMELANWNEGKGVLIRGVNGTFCSGGDLNFMNNLIIVNGGEIMSRYMTYALEHLSKIRMISVAVLEGSTLGGGAELAMACDFRVAAPTAKIGFVQVHMGLVPGWGGGAILVNKVGRTKALDILCSGRVMTADEAREVGLIEHITSSSEDTIEAAKAWLDERTFQSARVTRYIKQHVVLSASPGQLSGLLHTEQIRSFGKMFGAKENKDAIDSKTRHK